MTFPVPCNSRRREITSSTTDWTEGFETLHGSRRGEQQRCCPTDAVELVARGGGDGGAGAERFGCAGVNFVAAGC